MTAALEPAAAALDVARRLVAAGVPVFAAPPGDTSTGYRLPVGWQTFTADPKRLEVWRPGYALAAVCGHGVDVVDWDPRNGPEAFPCDMPAIYGQATTPSGGVHLYVAPTGLAKGEIAPGWDLQAGAADGSGRGFVFLPPTVRAHKVTGVPGTYGWIREPTVPGRSDGSAVALAAYMATRRRARREDVADGEREVLAGGTIGEPIPPGQHSRTLFEFMSRLRGHGVPPTEARALLDLRRRDCLPPCNNPREHEWDDLGGRPYRAYPAGAPPEPDITFEGPPTGTGGPAPGVHAPPTAPAESTGPQAVSWEAAWGPPEPVEWLVHGFIAARRGHALYSAPKVGKSLLALELAAAVARGADFLGRPTRQGRVVYVDHENDLRGDVVQRLIAMGLEPADLTDLLYYSMPAMAKLDTPRGGADLVRIAIEAQATLVVIDTAVRTISGEEKDNNTWARHYDFVGRPLKAAGIAYEQLDHSGKDESNGMRGGSDKAAAVDMVWQMKRDGDKFVLSCDFSRVLVDEPVIAFKRELEPLRSTRVTPPSDLERQAEQMGQVWAAMDEAGIEIDPLRADGKAPKGNGVLAREIREATGLKGRDGVLANVARVRWACSRPDSMGRIPPRPDWAPPAGGWDVEVNINVR